MFYSHQLLARKAALGQIWMAATMHAKINRRKLDKLDIIKICEEILNPSVPMALRLSGILMGGVVIVYEKKVKLLYDDVTRFLVEINEAWKVKTVADPTVLPKSKAQAKFEAVTLPDNVDMEVEQPMHSDASVATARFQRMRLDDLDELYINIDIGEEDPTHQHHQADEANITLFDDLGSCFAETDFYNRFERFDIEEEDDIHINFTSQEQPQMPSTLVPSPPPQDVQPQAPSTLVPSPPPPDEPPRDDGIKTHQMEEEREQQVGEGAKKGQPSKRKARRNLDQVIMDDEQIIILGNVYQSWLQDASNIISKRGRKTKPLNSILSTKISHLMDLPLVALIFGLEKFPGEVQYPTSLMNLWRKYMQEKPAHSSSSGGRSSQKAPQVLARHSLPRRLNPQDLSDFPAEDFHSQPLDFSIEKLRANLENMDFQGVNESSIGIQSVTPGSPGQSSRSIPSSGSGPNFIAMELEIQLPSGRSKRRQQSSSRTSLGNLDTVEEEFPLQQNVRDFKIRKLSETGPTLEFELMEETGPTQTPHPSVPDPSVDKITQSIRSHLKVHFDTPGAPHAESLIQLASGMNKKKAAQLFYQTCVLASCDFIKVKQAEPYGDIFISKGSKM